MRLADLGPVRSFVDKVTTLLAFEALDLAKVHRLPLAIVGVRFATDRDIVVILSKDNSAGGCA